MLSRAVGLVHRVVGSVPNGVQEVLGSGSPSEVLDSIIRVNAILMQTLQSRRARSDKSLEDEAMCSLALFRSISSEVYPNMARFQNDRL
jgi:hypothetical protein